MGFDDNADLFRQRTLIVDRLADLDVTDAEARVLRRRLDQVTTELLEANRGLAMERANRFRGGGRPLEDYEATAMGALYEAIASYDPDRGASFAHWAYPRIKNACIGTLRDTELSHLSRNDVDNRPAVRAALAAGANVEAAAEAAGTTTGVVERIATHHAPVSLAAPVVAEGSITLGDTVAELSDSYVDASDDERDAVVAAAGAVLAPRELFVFLTVHGLSGAPALTLTETGDMIGVSREAVRKTLARAEAKVRAELDSQWS